MCIRDRIEGIVTTDARIKQIVDGDSAPLNHDEREIAGNRDCLLYTSVFKRQKDSLTIVAFLAMGYIFVTALVMFNIEPDTFNSFFDAIYWATVSLTTVGYGDIYATSGIGKILTMISSLFGIAIVALPAGIITAGYMSEINADDKYN